MRHPTIRLMGILVFAAAMVWLMLALFAWLNADRMMFPAPRPSYSELPGLRRVAVTLPDGQASEVAAVYLPNPDARLTVFYQHGNGEDLGKTLDRLLAWHRNGFAVFAWDYPGYGLSPGQSSERAVLHIADQLAGYLRDELAVAADRTLVVGRSIGGGPAVWLATRAAYAGLVLEGTFTSTFRVFIPVKLLPWDRFDNLARIRGIQCPVLLLHGDNDETVPYAHSPRLFAAAPEPRQFVTIPGGRHNNLAEDHSELFWQAVRGFVAGLSE
jgi:abhydrolase domain-containing protein 17